jgi:hypothetical protein
MIYWNMVTYWFCLVFLLKIPSTEKCYSLRSIISVGSLFQFCPKLKWSPDTYYRSEGVIEVAWTNLASTTTATCPFDPILANHCSEDQFNLLFWMNQESFDAANLVMIILTPYQLSISTEFTWFKCIYSIEQHIQKQKEIGEVTNPVSAIGEKPVALLPGIEPFSLFLSNLSSTRFCSLPSSGGMFPVSPLECKFLQEMNE